MAYVLKRCRGQKPPTMIPTDCYALRAPTILPNIRISWCLRPTFMLILGRVTRSFYHQCASTHGVRPFNPGIMQNIKSISDKYSAQEKKNDKYRNVRKNSPGCPTEADRNGKLSGSGTEGQ